MVGPLLLIFSRLCRRPEAGLYGTKTCEACVGQRQWPGWKWKQFRSSEYRLSPSWRNLAMQVNSDIWKDEQPWKSNMWQQFWNRRSPKSQGYSLSLNFWLKTGQGMYNFSIKVCRVWSEQSSQSCSCCDHIFSGLDRWCLLCLILWGRYILVLLYVEFPTVIWNYILKLFTSNIQLLLGGFWNYTIRSSNGLGRSEGCVVFHLGPVEILFKNPKHLKAMLGSSLLLGWYPESMSCFSSLYLARARQHHVRWGEKLQARGNP